MTPPEYFQRTFRAAGGRTMQLTVRRQDGAVFMNKIWWDAGTLRYLGIYEVADNNRRLGQQRSPEFGDATKYEGKFTASRSYRKAKKW